MGHPLVKQHKNDSLQYILLFRKISMYHSNKRKLIERWLSGQHDDAFIVKSSSFLEWKKNCTDVASILSICINAIYLSNMISYVNIKKVFFLIF